MHSFVAKMSMDARDDKRRDIYFRDVEMQAYARSYARLFNKYNPPKKVDFVFAFILELVDRENNPICGVERYIPGEYKKHNNNHGYVSEAERNTPQAFSHFTYESSKKKILICDIQGVGDLYTDPQMHSVDKSMGFGKGNLGQSGIDQFLRSHRCNPICRYLKLEPINAYQDDIGTIPNQTFMGATRVGVGDTMDFSGAPVAYPPFLPVTSPLTKRTKKSKRENRFECCTIL